MTDRIRHLILATDFLGIEGSIASHSSYIACLSCSKLCDKIPPCWFLLLRMFQRCSIRLTSGGCPGHGSDLTFLSSFQFLTKPALWHGAPSYLLRYRYLLQRLFIEKERYKYI